MQLTELWYSHDQTHWFDAEKEYWSLVKPNNLAIEQELESLDSIAVSKMSGQEFYDFLHDKYFVWKYTAPNRLATTRKSLEKYSESMFLLQSIQLQLFSFDLDNIKLGLSIAQQIKGLGVAGASGLLAVLFPEYFGTVDQFAVEALKTVNGLDERADIEKMKKLALTIPDGEILIKIMRMKAVDLNKQFDTNYWTPRKIDKILWVIGR